VKKKSDFTCCEYPWKDFEVLDIYDAFASDTADRFTRVFWLGKLAIEETIDNDKRTITFSPI
jgi:hypothetical protein